MQFQSNFKIESGSLILKFIWKYKEPRIPKTVFLKTKFGDLTVHDFKTHHKAIEIKSAWYWHKFRQTDQWQSRETRVDPHSAETRFSTEQSNSVQK